jgi:hypothetical protein
MVSKEPVLRWAEGKGLSMPLSLVTHISYFTKKRISIKPADPLHMFLIAFIKKRRN